MRQFLRNHNLALVKSATCFRWRHAQQLSNQNNHSGTFRPWIDQNQLVFGFDMDLTHNILAVYSREQPS
jgi:hypothetical protein